MKHLFLGPCPDKMQDTSFPPNVADSCPSSCIHGILLNSLRWHWMSQSYPPSLRLIFMREHYRTIYYGVLQPCVASSLDVCRPSFANHPSWVSGHQPGSHRRPGTVSHGPNASPIEERILLQDASSTLIGLSYPWTKSHSTSQALCPGSAPNEARCAWWKPADADRERWRQGDKHTSKQGHHEFWAVVSTMGYYTAHCLVLGTKVVNEAVGL